MKDACADKDVRVFQVIETNLMVRGKGTQDSPMRRVKQYWTMDGEMLAEDDRYAPTHCNAVGHRLMPGSSKCEHCDATLAQIADAAGERILADRIRKPV